MFGKKSADYVNWLNKKEYLDGLPSDISVANTGSTAGCSAFDYSYWHTDGINLGSNSQTLYYDFQMLKEYGSHLKSGAIVFITIEHFKFLVDYYTDPHASYKYYLWLSPDKIHNYSKKTDFLLHMFPLVEDKRFLKQELLVVLHKLQRKKSNEYLKSDEDWADYWVAGWYKQFGWDNESDSLSGELSNKVAYIMDILRDMLNYCLQNDWTPYLVTVPMSPKITQKLPHEIMDACLWTPIKKYSEEGYKVIDLYHDEIFEDDGLYRDALTMNEKGKKLFNEVIQKLM